MGCAIQERSEGCREFRAESAGRTSPQATVAPDSVIADGLAEIVTDGVVTGAVDHRSIAEQGNQKLKQQVVLCARFAYDST